MQRHLETCQTRFTFSLWPPPFIIIMTFVHIHTSTSLLPKKTMAQKKLSHKFKSAKIKFFLRFLVAEIQPNSKKNRQISLHGFQ